MKLLVTIKSGEYRCYHSAQADDNSYLFRLEDTTPTKFGFKWSGGIDTYQFFSPNGEAFGGFNLDIKLLGKSKLVIRPTEQEEDNIEARVRFSKKSMITFTWKGLDYALKQYRGHYKALFVGDTQVASFNRTSQLNVRGISYVIWAKDTCNIPILLTLCLALYLSNEDDSTLTYDFGQFGFKKRSNPNWRPC